MPIFDTEAFRDHYVDLFKANLNAKIAEINTEKSDTIVLGEFTDAQFTSDLNEKVMNYASFIDYGFTDTVAESNGYGSFSLEITMFFAVVFSEPNGGALSETKIMRYTRALQEVAFADVGAESRIQGIEIQPFAPADMIDNLASSVVKVGGIQIKGTIA